MVFDFDVVVVIECRGRYCFFYIGHLLGLFLKFCGVCIDVMFYILLCDNRFYIVYMLDENG